MGEVKKGDSHIASTPRSDIYFSFSVIPFRSPTPFPEVSKNDLG
jgi:hypothetical protein